MCDGRGLPGGWRGGRIGERNCGNRCRCRRRRRLRLRVVGRRCQVGNRGWLRGSNLPYRWVGGRNRGDCGGNRLTALVAAQALSLAELRRRSLRIALGQELVRFALRHKRRRLNSRSRRGRQSRVLLSTRHRDLVQHRLGPIGGKRRHHVHALRPLRLGLGLIQPSHRNQLSRLLHQDVVDPLARLFPGRGSADLVAPPKRTRRSSDLVRIVLEEAIRESPSLDLQRNGLGLLELAAIQGIGASRSLLLAARRS